MSSSRLLNLRLVDIDLGQVGDDQGQTVDGNVYIDDLLIQEKYKSGDSLHS